MTSAASLQDTDQNRDSDPVATIHAPQGPGDLHEHAGVRVVLGLDEGADGVPGARPELADRLGRAAADLRQSVPQRLDQRGQRRVRDRPENQQLVESASADRYVVVHATIVSADRAAWLIDSPTPPSAPTVAAASSRTAGEASRKAATKSGSAVRNGPASSRQAATARAFVSASACRSSASHSAAGRWRMARSAASAFINGSRQRYGRILANNQRPFREPPTDIRATPPGDTMTALRKPQTNPNRGAARER